MQNLSNIGSRGTPNASEMAPGVQLWFIFAEFLRPEGLRQARRATTAKIHAPGADRKRENTNRKRENTVFRRFGDPPKSTKNRAFAKKDVPGSSFLTIFAARAFVHGFFIDSPSILA